VERETVRGSYRLFELFGIGVYVHVTFLLLLALIVGVSAFNGASSLAVLTGVAFLLLMFSCVLAHEFGHALMARRFGIRTLDITLLPIGGLARLQRMPEKPSQELLVALAGPMVNVVIAAGLYVFLVLARTHVPTVDAEGLAAVAQWPLVEQIFVANVILVVFNMLPAFPMDGGRVLRALLAMALSYERATAIAARVGQGMALVFVFVALTNGPVILFLIALFVWVAAKQEAAQVSARAMMRGMTLDQAVLTGLKALRPEASLAQAMEILYHSAQRDIPLLDEQGQWMGLANAADITRTVQARGLGESVGVAARHNVPVLDARVSLEQAAQQLQEAGQQVAAVMRDGVFAGLVDGEHLQRLIALRGASASGTQPAASASWRLRHESA
jgi:Zn-dependent protease/CBS domain-containing protein